MSTSHPPSFDLRLLPSFVVVAQELHFGRAAERLFIAQPALSRQIARLEQQLGVTLFDRSSRGVELTADGATLLNAALDILRHAARAETAAQGGGEGLRVHLSDSLPPDVVVAVHTVSATEPGLQLTLLDGTHADSLRAVVEGRAEVGFEFLEGVPDGLAYAPFSRQRWGVMCVDGHPLTRGSSASWSDLEGLTLMVAPPGVIDGYNLALNAVLRRFGVSCNRVDGPSRVRPAYLQTYVGRGDRVLVCAEFIMAPRLPGLCWVPLEPEASHEWGVIWDEGRATEETRRFVQAMSRLGDVWSRVDEPRG